MEGFKLHSEQFCGFMQICGLKAEYSNQIVCGKNSSFCLQRASSFRFLMKGKYSHWPFNVCDEIALDYFPNEIRIFVVSLQQDCAISIRIDRSIEVL